MKPVALLVSLLALTTPVNGQNFLKKLKDAANNASDKMNTAVEKTGNASANVAVPTASGPTYYVSRSGSNKTTDSVLQQQSRTSRRPLTWLLTVRKSGLPKVITSDS